MRGVIAAAGAVLVLAVAALLVVAAVGSERPLVITLEPGQCFELPESIDDSLDSVDVVECGGPHDAEVVAAGELAGGSAQPYPGDAVFELVDARCAVAFDRQPALADRFGLLPVVADERSWERFAGRYVCVAIPYGGGTTSGSIVAPAP